MEEIRDDECGMRNPLRPFASSAVFQSTDPTTENAEVRREFPHPHLELRPRDLAMLLLASGDLLPRKRARDQQADRAGLEIKKRLLKHVADIDPEPDEMETVLAQLIDEWGPPTGPTRAIAGIIRDEWQAARAAPEWIGQLLNDAVNENSKSEIRSTKSESLRKGATDETRMKY